MTAERRSILIVGAGSLGSVYGARLARAADVQLLARRPHAEAVRRAGGVLLSSDEGSSLCPLRAEWRPERLAPADTVIVATKGHDTRSALAGLGHVLGGLELALSLQNGVDTDRPLADWCGPERVIGAVSMVGATLERPGHVRHTLAGTTYLGELPAGVSPRVRALAELLGRAGLPTVTARAIRSAEWSKLVHAAPTMTLTALTRRPLHRVLGDERLARLYVHLVREGAAVADAAGVAIADWPGMFPVRTLADATTDEALALLAARARAMADAGATAVRISMLEDVERGRRLELDAVHRALVDEARRRGVAAPLTAVSLELLDALAPATAS